MTKDAVAKNLLLGKSCDSCCSTPEEGEICLSRKSQHYEKPFPKERTCEFWGFVGISAVYISKYE
jgi:hypothetical protein